MQKCKHHRNPAPADGLLRPLAQQAGRGEPPNPRARKKGDVQDEEHQAALRTARPLHQERPRQASPQVWHGRRVRLHHYPLDEGRLCGL